MTNSDQPIPILYNGQTGSYFGTEYEKLPLNLPADIRDVGQMLNSKGLKYLGKLTCSNFSDIEVYSFSTSDRKIAVSIMVGSSGLTGIDCVSKFSDNSFLTTTTNTILSGAYDEQQLFRVSFPNLNATELLQQHTEGVADFELQHGIVQAIFSDLLEIAKLVDEYTVRQQSTPGHGFFQLTSGFANARAAEMMGDDYDPDLIEYDLDTASPLVQAILQEDLERVKTLIEDGVAVNPNGKNGYEEEPLVAAVYQGNPEIIQTLIAARVDLDRLDTDIDAFPLGLAIKKNRLDLVQLLLNAGANPDGCDFSDTALAIAIHKDNYPILQMLLEAGANPNAGMEDDYRAVMLAANYGCLEMVELLVLCGADVNAWSQGTSAIESAARNAHQDVYDYLYPLLDEENKRWANKHGQKEIAKAKKRKARKANKLGEKLGDAAVFGKLNKVKELLKEGADPNVITENGKTPLIYAAMYGHQNIMEVLLDAGADPNLQGDEDGDEGQTALMEVASSFWAKNRADVIKFLVDRGADPDIQNAEGETALMIAGDLTDAVKALIDAGANLDLKDKQGKTALMKSNWAVRQLLRKAGASETGMNNVALVDAAFDGNLKRVKAAIEAGADIDYSDGNALVTVAGKGYKEIVEYLIVADADVNLGWKTGLTPIAEAAYQGYLGIVEKLLEAGADPWQRCHDDEFYDALDYARQGQLEGNRSHKGTEHQAIIELLTQRQS